MVLRENQPGEMASPEADPFAAPADRTLDGGETGCGELLIDLALAMRRLAPGQMLDLITLDPGSPADLPAWCRMTGHRLVASQGGPPWRYRVCRA